MTHSFKNPLAVAIIACASLAACASPPFVGPSRESDVMKAQLAAPARSKPAMSSDEGERIYMNYLNSTGKPVRPTSGNERLSK